MNDLLQREKEYEADSIRIDVDLRIAREFNYLESHIKRLEYEQEIIRFKHMALIEAIKTVGGI